MQKVWELPVYWLHNSWPGILRGLLVVGQDLVMSFLSWLSLGFFRDIINDLVIQHDSTDSTMYKKQVTMEKQCPYEFPMSRIRDWNLKKDICSSLMFKTSTEQHKRSVSVACIMIPLSFFYHGFMQIILLHITTKWATTTYKYGYNSTSSVYNPSYPITRPLRQAPWLHL